MIEIRYGRTELRLPEDVDLKALAAFLNALRHHDLSESGKELLRLMWLLLQRQCIQCNFPFTSTPVLSQWITSRAAAFFRISSAADAVSAEQVSRIFCSVPVLTGMPRPSRI